MSEELLQAPLPQPIGRYEYLRLGNTTLDQLKRNGLIPRRNYGAVKNKKPDGLIFLHRSVVAVVEYKVPEELRTPAQIQKAIGQEIDVARALCRILIVTDGTKTFWINALTGQFITDHDGHELNTVFHPARVQKVAALEFLLDQLLASLSETCSQLQAPKLVDPTPLATRLWQTIWVATGKSPVKCLYNVVELFIFKFLSDLRVLEDYLDFDRVHLMTRSDPNIALEYYARNTRPRIRKLFPSGSDGTTIINGTIFVTEAGEPNLTQSILFARCLDHLKHYTEEFGSLTQIDKRFKTKLYETFLSQEAEALGQYFTPRKIVQTMIRMAGLDDPAFQFGGKRICDPFCGVGGFPLEILNLNESMRVCYRPDDQGRVSAPFVLHGFDKGFERDDERTIILAKANMLIYLAELLFASPHCSTGFASVFNETFHLFKDNLGTFGHIIDKEPDKYDYILSNPPYVTSGSSIIKEEVRRSARTAKAYPINALGLEGLALEWIISALKPGGHAFIVIPDGLLARVSGKRLRDYILEQCCLNAIVSLPKKTFFANEKQTYILSVTKKHAMEDVQTYPVFTYLVSNIGERLTSVKREEIDEDDLPLMEACFKYYWADRKNARGRLEQESARCKIQDIAKFSQSPHWVIDRWWTKEERQGLGIDEKPGDANEEELDDLLSQLKESTKEYGRLKAAMEDLSLGSVRECPLGNTTLFKLFIGTRVLKRDTRAEGVPVYSANVHKPLGYVPETNVEDLTKRHILWGIDGNFDLRLVAPGEAFATTDHCGAVAILDPGIVPEYLLCAMSVRREEESFDRSFRASLSNMRRFVVRIPVDGEGRFDVDAQWRVARRVLEVQRKADEITRIRQELDAVLKGFVSAPL